MKGWRFSWRAVLGWAAGSLAAGALVGLTLSISNIFMSPEDKAEFWSDSAALVLVGALVFLPLSGVSELVASFAWRLSKWWRRPWCEMILCAVICYGLVHAPGVNVTFSGDGLDPASIAQIAFFAIEGIPPLAGALATFVYWLIARPQRD